jgi:hypothetical protein
MVLHVPGRRITGCANKRNSCVRCTGRARTRLFSDGTECKNDRDNRAGACLTVKASLPLSPVDLLLKCESNSQSDLIMSDRPFFDMASRLHDFEPFHFANGL